jgi:hypothetical protein
MSEAKLVDFFDREYSEPPTGLDRAHMASLETSERYGVTVRTESRADRPGDLLIYADDMLWGVVQIAGGEAWKKPGVLSVYEYDCYGIDWTRYPNFPGKQACSHRGRYFIPGGFDNLDAIDAMGEATAQFVFRNLRLLQGGPLAPKYAEVEGSESAPRRRYQLLKDLKQKNFTVKAGSVSGLIDGPWQLPQTDNSWVDEDSSIAGQVKLSNDTYVSHSDIEFYSQDSDLVELRRCTVLSSTIKFSTGREQECCLEWYDVFVESCTISGETLLSDGVRVSESYIHNATIPAYAYVHNIDLDGDPGGRTPFIQMNAVGPDDMALTMWRNKDGDIEAQCGSYWGLLDMVREKLSYEDDDLLRLELLNLLNAGESHLEILEAIGERNG